MDLRFAEDSSSAFCIEQEAGVAIKDMSRQHGLGEVSYCHVDLQENRKTIACT